MSDGNRPIDCGEKAGSKAGPGRPVLMIAYFFPPGGDVGIYRTIKFAKYLPEFGWRPIVLTQGNGKFNEYHKNTLDFVPAHAEVHRTWSFEALNEGKNREGVGGLDKMSLTRRIHRRLCVAWWYMSVPDNRWVWAITAARRARRLIRQQAIRHVYISGKPFSSFLIGCYLKRTEKVGVVLDYRDPWTQNINYTRRTSLHWRIERWMEKCSIRRADVVIANTKINQVNLRGEFGDGEPDDKFETIHNGFDAEDFVGTPVDRSDKFTITYAGVFYYRVGSDYERSAGNDVMKTYSPLYFFEALERLFDRRPDIKPRLQVHFMGVLGTGYEPIIEARGLKSVVHRLGYLDYDDHILELKRAHALLLVLSKGERSRGWIPSKFFQYLGSGNPILGLVPRGEVRDIIESAGAGLCAEPDDVDAIAAAIEELYDSHKNASATPARDGSVVDQFERRRQTGMLSQILDRV